MSLDRRRLRCTSEFDVRLSTWFVPVRLRPRLGVLRRVTDKAYTPAFGWERYEPTGGSQFAPQPVEHGANVMRAVRLRPDQCGKLLVAQRVRGTMKDIQDLLLPPRELDVEVGHAASA